MAAFVVRTELFSLSFLMSSAGAACAAGTAGVTDAAYATDAASAAVSGLSGVTSSRSISPPAGNSAAFSGRLISRVFEDEML